MNDIMKVKSKFLTGIISGVLKKFAKNQGLNNLNISIDDMSLEGSDGKFYGRLAIHFNLPYEDVQNYLKDKDIL